MEKHTKKYYMKKIAAAQKTLSRWEAMYRRMKKIADYRYENGIIDTPEYDQKASLLWESCLYGIYQTQKN